MFWDTLPAKSPHRRTLFLAENPDGTLREATNRELYLGWIGCEWAAAGQVVPSHVMAKAAADYDAAGEPPDFPALDLAA